jgi:hypothetical protein
MQDCVIGSSEGLIDMPQKDKEKPKDLAVGAVDYSSLVSELKVPERKGLYQWEEIAKTLKGGQAYVLPASAKKNSILTGLRREKVQGKIAQHIGTGQLVIVPVKD